MALKIIKKNDLIFLNVEKKEKTEQIIKYKTKNIKNLRKIRLNEDEIKELAEINKKYNLFDIKDHNSYIKMYEEFINETIAITIFGDFYTEVVSDMKKDLEEDTSNNSCIPYLINSDNFIKFSDYKNLGSLLLENYTYTFDSYEIINLESYYFQMLLENIEIYTISSLNKNNLEKEQLVYSKTLSKFFMNKIKILNIEDTFKIYNNKNHENIFRYVEKKYIRNEKKNNKITIMDNNFKKFSNHVSKNKDFISFYFFLNTEDSSLSFNRKINKKTPDYERILDMFLMDYIYTSRSFSILIVENSVLKNNDDNYLKASISFYDNSKGIFVSSNSEIPSFVKDDFENKNLIKSSFNKDLLKILNNKGEFINE